MAKNHRRAARTRKDAQAWIRLGFSVRPCVIADISDSGVQLVVDAPAVVAQRFVLLQSRAASQGRACQVKWRRGSRIGAEFVS